MSSYKRNILILTDNVELVNKEYSKYFKRAEFAKQVLVEDVTNFSPAVFEQIGKAKNTILFLTDTEKYISDLFLNSAIMHMTENQNIDYVVVDSIDNWMSIENAFYEYNSELRNKNWTENENLFDWFHLEDLIRCLQENAVPENVVIAFISDNHRYIDKLFDDLLKKWNGDDDGGDDGDGNDGPINSKKHLPINGRLPRIFMGWIWRIWYAPVKTDRKHFDANVKEETDDDVVGYVRRSVILNLGDKSITYIHIVPNMMLDLSEVLDSINTLYFDLNTHYGSIFISHNEVYPSHVNYIPFLSRVKFRLYNTYDWMDVFKNYIDIANTLVGFKEYHVMNNFEGEYYDKITHTVNTAMGGLKVPRISIIRSIDPPKTKEEETEPGPVEEEPDATPASLEELETALADDEVSTIRLDADITDAVGLSVTNGAEKTIDLNCHSITGASDLSEDNWGLKVFSGKLNIIGEGSVNGGSGCPNDVCIWAYSEDSEINIYGGSYDVGLDVNGDTNSTIYSEGGATINIYDGEFSNSGAWSVGKDGHVLNIKNNDGSYIICYGGTYYHQNPADGDDKDTTTGATFVANGYEVEETSDGVYVVVSSEQFDDN